MRNMRDSRANDPDFIAWQKDYQAEQDAAQAAAASTPEAQYKAALNELHAAERDAVLHGVISDVNLAKFGTVVRGSCSEEQKVLARTEFREMATDYVRNSANRTTLCAMVDRNGLHPGNPYSYLLCHEICKLWGLYTTEADPEPQPTTRYADVEIVDPRSTLTPSERAIYDHQQYIDKIVGHDELGKGWTEAELDQLPSKDELRLRRLFEQGHRGSNLLTIRREVLDIKAQQDADRARQAAEENR
jgi:hypothetical protein